MFVCPEIERTTFTAEQLVNMYVNEVRIDTNETQIQGISADGDNGVWRRLKRGYVKRDDTSPVWFAKDGALQFFGKFPALDGDFTIVEAAARMQIDIDNQTGLIGKLYWKLSRVYEIESPFWFTVFTPDGLRFMLPSATGTDRGTVFKADVIIRQIFDRSIGYYGSGDDIEVCPYGNILYPSLDASYASMVVNKATAAANYMVFAANKVCGCGDYVRSWDGKKYVILSGRKTDSKTYEYTAVLESVTTVTAPAVMFGTGGSVPVGTIIGHGSETVPTGWLACEGQSLLRANYPDLFAAIGTSWGYADATHFNLPDGRGRFMRGWANGSSNDPDRAARTANATNGQTGDNVGSVQADELKTHRHTRKGYAVPRGTGANIIEMNETGATTYYTGYSGGNETRPKNFYAQWIIKF